MFNRVRRYSLRDKDSIRKLCLDNCDLENRSEENLSAVLLMYCDYYLECEQNTCFVAVDEKDEVIGYILCAPDFEIYKERFNKDFRTEAINYGIENYVAAGMNMIPYSMYKDLYPAHFHIDVASDYRRQGIGTKMLAILKKELSASGIKGIMCVCGENNESGIAFYEKNGFKKTITTKLGISYSLELATDE